MRKSSRASVIFCAALMLLKTSLTSAEIGVSYTIWGKNVCPSGTEQIYKGFMSGPSFNTSGGGTNYLCLTDQPVKDARVVESLQNTSQSRIFGTKYGLYGDYAMTSLFSAAKSGVENLNDNNIPCTVCYRPGNTAKFTIYGRVNCGNKANRNKYTLEYSGKVMAEASDSPMDRLRTSFVCVDKEPKALEQTGGEHGLIYPVQVMCGPILCNPYQEGNELGCAVCTR